MSEAEQDPEPEHEGQGKQEPKLRRSLLGYRTKDVDAELAARRAEMEELRADVAALWLAFGQHERTIRHLIAAMEAFEGPAAPATPPPTGPSNDVESEPERAQNPTETPSPPPSPVPTPDPDASGGSAESTVPVPADMISAQLEDLDGVLEAIEKATRSLERTYAEEIAPSQPDEETPETGPGQEADEGPASGPEPESR